MNIQEIRNRVSEMNIRYVNVTFPCSTDGTMIYFTETETGNEIGFGITKQGAGNLGDKLKYKSGITYGILSKFIQKGELQKFCDKVNSAVGIRYKNMIVSVYDNKIVGFFVNYNPVKHETILNEIQEWGNLGLNVTNYDLNMHGLTLLCKQRFEHKLGYSIYVQNGTSGLYDLSYGIAIHDENLNYLNLKKVSDNRHLSRVNNTLLPLFSDIEKLCISVVSMLTIHELTVSELLDICLTNVSTDRETDFYDLLVFESKKSGSAGIVNTLVDNTQKWGIVKYVKNVLDDASEVIKGL